MKSRETKHEFCNWSVIIIFGYGDIELSVVSILLLQEVILTDNMCKGEMNREKSIGPRTDPCGTPVVHIVTADVEQPIQTH